MSTPQDPAPYPLCCAGCLHRETLEETPYAPAGPICALGHSLPWESHQCRDRTPQPETEARELRRRLGWSQARLGVALGIDRTQIARRETGETRVRPIYLLAIKQLLSVGGPP